MCLHLKNVTLDLKFFLSFFMSNTSKLFVFLVILLLLGLCLPYFGINIFTEPPFEDSVTSRRDAFSSNYLAPLKTYNENDFFAKNQKVKNKNKNQTKPKNQNKSFDDIIAEINNE